MNREEITETLLSKEDFHSKGSELDSQYSIERDNKSLYFYGCTHTNDISHPQFNEIEQLATDFIRDKNKKYLFLVEGGYIDSYDSKEESIEEDGEAGLLTYLGYTNEIKVISPEPTLLENIEPLLVKFTKEEIAYFLFARTVYQ